MQNSEVSLGSDADKFFNKIIFTKKNIPLPLCDDEEIFCFFKDVKFYSCIGKGGLINTIIYSAPTGSLFLTNYRIIYKPSTVYKNDINF